MSLVFASLAHSFFTPQGNASWAPSQPVRGRQKRSPPAQPCCVPCPLALFSQAEVQQKDRYRSMALEHQSRVEGAGAEGEEEDARAGGQEQAVSSPRQQALVVGDGARQAASGGLGHAREDKGGLIFTCLGKEQCIHCRPSNAMCSTIQTPKNRAPP